jgi:hypothetical protein
VWSYVAWGLPLFLILRGFLGDTGGWEALLLLIASPVLVPALGLLGMLPRFLLRRKGVRVPPPPLVWLLWVHWCAWIGHVLALPGTGDSGSAPSLLQAIVPALSPTANEAVFFPALFAAGITWLVILAIAVRSPREDALQRG